MSLLDDVGDEVGTDQRDQIAQGSESCRHHRQGHPRHQQRGGDGQHEKRPGQPVRGDACRIHHNQFRIAVEAVQRVERRHEQGDRRDTGDQRGQRKQRYREEDHDGLALAGDKIDLAQRLRHPDHACQPNQEDNGRDRGNLQDVTVEALQDH